MKRILAFCLMLILVISLWTVPAHAAGNGALTLSNTVGSPGDDVTMTIGLSTNPGLITLKLSLTYDSDLELTAVNGAGILNGFIEPEKLASPCTLFWKDSLAKTDNTATGNVAVLTFHIKEGVSNNGKNVSVSSIDSFDTVGQRNTISSATGTVSFGCSHNWSATESVPATCISFSHTTYTCTYCHVARVEYGSTLAAHDFGSWAVTTPATCTTPGTETRECVICHREETKSIIATGHTFGNWTTVSNADCTHDGERMRSCLNCDFVEHQAVPRTGHDYKSFDIVRQPTCTESGLKRGTCKNCGSVNAEEPIPALGHSFGGWSDTLAATCTEGGTRVRSCTRCPAKEEEATEPLGHEFADPIVVRSPSLYATGLVKGVCTRCNEATDQITPCSVTDTGTGIHVETETGVFPEGATMTTDRLSGNDARLTSLSNALSEIATTFTAYDISFSVKGSPIQPVGTYTAVFPIPEGYNGELLICYVGEDGVAVPLKTEVDETAATLTADLYAGGLYAVCLMGGGVPINHSNLSDTTLSNLWVYILLAAVVIIMLILVVLLILSHRKTDTPEGPGSPDPQPTPVPVTPADAAPITPTDAAPVTPTDAVTVTPTDTAPVTPTDAVTVTPTDATPVTPTATEPAPTDAPFFNEAAPVQPVIPTEPVTPADPVVPAEPVTPADPMIFTEPVTPAEPTVPAPSDVSPETQNNPWQ